MMVERVSLTFIFQEMLKMHLDGGHPQIERKYLDVQLLISLNKKITEKLLYQKLVW